MLRIDLTELKEVVQRLDHDVKLISNLEQNDYFREVCRDIIKKNFTEVWRSKGRAINEDWAGRTLVKSGNLRDSLTTNRIDVAFVGGALVFSSPVYYSTFVNDLYKFYGITEAANDDLTSAVGEVLRREGQLQWSVNR